MRVVCAWCEKEGNPSLLGEKAPWENPRTTSHGLCGFHKRRFVKEIETGQPASAPTHLCIVKRGDRELYEWARREFVDVLSIRVILDRRVRQRRWRIAKVRAERRRARDRRQRPGVDHQMRTMGYAIVELRPRDAP